METEITSPASDPKEASYRRGYDDFKESTKKKTGLLGSSYAPVAGYEEDYKAGWDKAQAEEDKRTARGAGLSTLIIGACAVIGGIFGIYICSVLVTAGVLPYGLFFLFGLFTLFGVGLLIRGVFGVISGRSVGND